GPDVPGYQKSPAGGPCAPLCGGPARGSSAGQGHLGGEAGFRAGAKCPGTGKGVGFHHRDLYRILWGEPPGDPRGRGRGRRHRPWGVRGHPQDSRENLAHNGMGPGPELEQYKKRSMEEKGKKFETQAIRTQMERSQYLEHSSPLYLTSSFVFEDAEDMRASFAEEK